MAKKKRASKLEIAARLKLLREEGKKHCTNCEETKDASEFAKDKRHYDGLQTYCRDCCNLLRRTKYGDKVRATSRKRHHENKEANNARALEYYYENKEHLIQTMKEWRAQNVEHRREYRKRYHEEHYETENAQARERMKQWIRDNPERHQENMRLRMLREKNAEGEHTLEQWKALLALCGHKCLACGDNETKLFRDHIVPLSKGGADSIANIQPLCQPCNSVKYVQATDHRPRPIKEWAERQASGDE